VAAGVVGFEVAVVYVKGFAGVAATAGVESEGGECVV
jgi:hypothetical protein